MWKLMFYDFIIVLMNVRATVSQLDAKYRVGVGPYPDEYYCKNLGSDHVMCAFYDVNGLCKPFDFWPREYVKKIFGDGIIQNIRNDYATARRGEGLNVNPDEYQIPNMNLLVWDDELTALAERYVYQCPRQIYPSNDVGRFSVGQILLESVHPTRFEDITHKFVQQFLFDPEQEIHQFHVVGYENGRVELLSNYNETYPMSLITNPYFQYYGCAVAKMRQVVDVSGHKSFKSLLVCNFGPLTNDAFTKVQPRGEPCSKCPEGRKCKKESNAPNLCQEFNEPEDEQTTMETRVETTNATSNSTTVSSKNPNEQVSTSTSSAQSTSTSTTVEEKPITTKEEGSLSTECFIKCGNGVPHIRCVSNDHSSDYEEVIMLRGMEVRDSILAWHNIIRNTVAEGIQGYPMAGNMRELQWNLHLEKSAVLWASQCKPYKYGCQDEYLTEESDYPTRVTQLVAPFIWDFNKGLPPYTQAVHNWLLGMKHFNSGMLQSYLTPEKGKDYASFAQLIWANTYMLGCGVALCHHKIVGAKENDTDLDYHEDMDEGESLIVTVCNYAPGGLMDGKAVYLVGGPCSLCTRLRKDDTGGIYCSKEYISLCSGANSELTAFCQWMGLALVTLNLYS